MAKRQEIITTHTANIIALIRDILSDKSVDKISYEDRHFIFIAERNTAKESTFAIGFTADIAGNAEEANDE